MSLAQKQLIEHLKESGYLKDKAIEKAMLKVPREAFVADSHKEHAYADEPLPIPPFDGLHTISAPHTYPLFYQHLKLKKGDRFLEIGTGSGYGAAIAAEIVGEENVVTIETTKETYEFAKENLRTAGYHVLVLLGDGTKGYPPKAPYTKIVVTASHPNVPKPLIGQLAPGGRMLFPQGPRWPSQDLVMIEKNAKGETSERIVDSVVYVPLIGEHGWK